MLTEGEPFYKFHANNNHTYHSFRDQLLSKKYKWTHKFYDHLLGVTLVNCLILKRCMSHCNLQTLHFRLELLHQLRLVAVSKLVIELHLHHCLKLEQNKKHLLILCTPFQLPPNVSISPDDELIIAPRHQEIIKKYEEEGHTLEHLPNEKRKRCIFHSCKKSRNFCPICEVGLCDHLCYSKWHFLNPKIHGSISDKDAQQQSFLYAMSNLKK